MIKIFRKIKLNFLIAMSDWDRNDIIFEEEKEWLGESYRDAGFSSYCKTRNLEILKGIANATHNRDFQKAIELNGQRLEILKLQTRASNYYNKSVI